MAQPGNFTPILLYASSTAAAVPSAANLTNSATGSEIAINVADKNLFFKDSGGTVNTVPIRQSNTSSNGWLSYTDWNTFNGKAPATSGTSLLYGNGSGGFSNVTIGSGITFAGGTLSATGTGGTVTSVAATVPAFLSVSGSPITTNGTLAISYSGTALPVANGGTGLTSFTSGGILYASSTSALATSSNFTWNGSQIGIVNSSGGAIINGSGAGTNGIYGVLANTSGALYWGVESSTGGNVFTGSSAYASVLIAAAGKSFQVGGNGQVGTTFDTNGNLLVGTTTATTANNSFQIQINGNGAGKPSLLNSGASSNNGDSTYILYSTTAAQYQFYVGYGGTVYARSTSITGLSDISEKENIKDIDTGLNAVLALKPRRFDWKNGSSKNVAGFIAQEVEIVLPDLVEEYKLNNEEIKKGLKMGDMIPTLVKAIQELNTKFEAYVASHP